MSKAHLTDEQETEISKRAVRNNPTGVLFNALRLSVGDITLQEFSIILDEYKANERRWFLSDLSRGGAA